MNTNFKKPNNSKSRIRIEFDPKYKSSNTGNAFYNTYGTENHTVRTTSR